jgi:hypothetical protein
VVQHCIWYDIVLPLQKGGDGCGDVIRQVTGVVHGLREGLEGEDAAQHLAERLLGDVPVGGPGAYQQQILLHQLRPALKPPAGQHRPANL